SKANIFKLGYCVYQYQYLYENCAAYDTCTGGPYLQAGRCGTGTSCDSNTHCTVGGTYKTCCEYKNGRFTGKLSGNCVGGCPQPKGWGTRRPGFSLEVQPKGCGTGAALNGHNLGNILLTALTQISGGSLPRAIEVASRVLSIRGRILPVSLDSTILCAELDDGTVIEGESAIPKRLNRQPIRRIYLRRREGDEHLPCRAYQEAVRAILEAEAIIIGPGSLYTSVMPNLALPEIVEALRRSRALKIYVCNVMAEPGETDGYSVSDHVQALLDHAPIQLDYVVVNDGIASDELIRQYVREELLEQFHRIKAQAEEAVSALDGPECSLAELTRIADQIAELSGEMSKIIDPARVQVLYKEEVDAPRLRGIKVIREDLITEVEISEERGGKVVRKRVIRHDPLKLAQVLAHTLAEG
ncbi:MAG: YvcK family protein, partial [Anaerolineae bacterium]|nr:YvcK family protein [Anaerolineae bacterium]